MISKITPTIRRQLSLSNLFAQRLAEDLQRGASGKQGSGAVGNHPRQTPVYTDLEVFLQFEHKSFVFNIHNSCLHISSIEGIPFHLFIIKLFLYPYTQIPNASITA